MGSNGCLFYQDNYNPEPFEQCDIHPFDTVAYVGINKETSNDTIYGWMKISSNYPFNITLYSLAYNIETTGISEATSNRHFSIFPNPTSDELNISGAFQGDCKLTICDLTGNLIYTDSFKENQFRINTRELNSGMYLLQITDKKGMSSQKFIKN